MPHHPAPLPTATTNTPARRRWRTPARRALLVAAGVGAAATALAVQGCADARNAATGLTGPARIAPTAAPGVLDMARGAAGARGGTDAGVDDLAWVGALHNRGLDAVLARARRAGPDDRSTAKTRCTLIGRLTAEFLVAERGRDPHLAALGAGRLGDDQLAELAREMACAGRAAFGYRLGDVGAAGALAAADGERRAALGDDGELSSAAAFLLGQVDDAIRGMAGASTLDANLTPVVLAAGSLPDEAERILVVETVATARASAYYHEQHCAELGLCGGGGGPPPDATGVERRAGVISDTVKADAYGCFVGGLRGMAGGPPGIFAGCFWAASPPRAASRSTTSPDPNRTSRHARHLHPGALRMRPSRPTPTARPLPAPLGDVLLFAATLGGFLALWRLAGNAVGCAALAAAAGCAVGLGWWDAYRRARRAAAPPA